MSCTTPLELIDRIAARWFPATHPPALLFWRVGTQLAAQGCTVTALATPAQAAPVLGASISTGSARLVWYR